MMYEKLCAIFMMKCIFIVFINIDIVNYLSVPRLLRDFSHNSSESFHASCPGKTEKISE